MAKTNDPAKIGAGGILYIMSRVGTILASFGLFALTIGNNTAQVGTIYAKTFSVCNVMASTFGIVCLILYFQRRAGLRIVQALAFLAALIGYGAMAVTAFQEDMIPMMFIMIAAFCWEAVWTLYIFKSKHIAARLAAGVRGLGAQQVRTTYQNLRPATAGETRRAMIVKECREIASIISNGHPGISQQLGLMGMDFNAYFLQNKGRYAERGISDGNAGELMWIGMVDELIQYHYAVEVDWKAEIADILLNLTLIVKRLGLPILFDEFSPSDAAGNNTESALREIGGYLLRYGIIMGYIDIDSDSTVLFLTGPDAPPMLQERAQRAWGRIHSAPSKEEYALLRNKISFSFARHDFMKDAEIMPRFDRVGARKALRLWLGDIAEKERIPEGIAAFNFGLFEPYGVDLTGSRKYDSGNDDWACEEDFIPLQRSCPNLILDPAMPWQQALCGMASAIAELMAELPGNPVLWAEHVTIGFSDGDLFPIERPKGVQRPDPSDAEAVPPELDYVIHDFIEETKQPALLFTPKREKPNVYNSKLGGVPYLPPDFTYPTDVSAYGHNDPLKLLCQLNFDELPKLPAFPQRGILQFYASTEDQFGLDFDNPRSQKGFRVIYHKDIIRDESALQAPPAIKPEDEEYFPFDGEFLLAAKLEAQGMSPSDFRFDDKFTEIYRRYFDTDAAHAIDIPSKQYEKVWEALGGTGSRCGGYPFFTQTDPREDSAELDNHTVLLLQIDSDPRLDILWGDSGVANFFITKEKLSALQFDDVVYNWDCY